MTNRDLFQNSMHDGRFNRMPVVHWTGWPETMARWYAEGVGNKGYYNGNTRVFKGKRVLKGGCEAG